MHFIAGLTYSAEFLGQVEEFRDTLVDVRMCSPMSTFTCVRFFGTGLSD